MQPDIIFTIAAKEFRNSLRNRWVLVVSVILALLALSISYFGSAPSGRTGFGSFEITIVSLASLVTYLVPIIALTLGFDAIVGESEGKTLELLLTMPVARFELFLGKFLGLGLAIAASIGGGFGLAGFLIALKIGTAQLSAYFIFIITAILLGLAFLSLSMLISAVVNERAKAIGWVVFVWFFFVLIFDLTLIGILVGTEGKVPPGLFSLLLYLNPTDIFRLINLTSVEGIKISYGLATLAKGGAFRHAILYSGMFTWVVLPLFVGYIVFKKKAY